MSKWCVYLVLALFSALYFMKGCGGSTGSDGYSSSSSSSSSVHSLKLLIEDPDPASSSQSQSSSNSKSLNNSENFSVSKTLTRVNPTSCTLTVSASDMDTVTQTFTYASTVNVEVTIPTGSNRTFAVDCSDSSGTTNDITVGFEGSTTADLTGEGGTITLSPKFKNLVSDDADGIQFLRLNQENSTETRLTFGFGQVLTDAEKLATRCIAEMDAAGTRTSLGVIDASRSDGLTTRAKTGPYFLLTGGTAAPDCFLYDANDAKQMRATGSWATNDDGNTEARCTFGITQNKNQIDTDQSGQFAAACSLTGSTPYDLIPNSGYAKYNLSPHVTTSDVSSLASNNATCSTSRNGETCSSGWCLGSGICSTLEPTSFSSTVAESGGTGVAGSTDGAISAARFNNPQHIAVSPDGNSIYVADSLTGLVRKINLTVATTSASYVSTLAGTGSGTVNGGCTTVARFRGPRGIVVNPAGDTIYVSDFISPGGTGSAIRSITLSPCTVGTLAGTGSPGSADGIGTAASFNSPTGLAITSDGKTLYVSDTENATIRKIVIASGVVTTFAGTAGSTGSTNGTGSAARFLLPNGLAIDPTDSYMWVATSSKIRKVVLVSGVVTTLSTSSAFTTLLGGIALDPTNKYLYVTHQIPAVEDQILKVTISDGTVTEITDTASASLNAPVGLAFVPGGSTLYYADTSNNKIKKF